MQERPEVKRGRQIGEKIRRLLLNCDLRIVYGKGCLDLSKADFKLNARIGKSKQALRAKMKREQYKIYIADVTKVKSEVSFGLNEVLERYSPVYKKIWIMYFIEQARIEDIARVTNYSYDNIRKITEKLKLDLSSFYEDKTNDKF